MSRAENERKGRLTKLFFSTIKEERSLRTLNEAKTFLEACVSRCKEKSPGQVVELLFCQRSALAAVRSAMRMSLTASFISDSSLPFISQLSDPEVERLGGGQWLGRVLLDILHPSTFWDAVLQTYRERKLSDENVQVFAWLCLQAVTIHSEDVNLEKQIRDVEDLVKSKEFFHSACHEVRVIHCRIEKVLRSRLTDLNTLQTEDFETPGGRHDNDFADFRQIAIFPTNDEVLSQERPFLQRLEDAFQVSEETRAQNYLDWLFRLLREDMLAELRDDIKTAFSKKGRRKPTILGGLSYAGCDFGNEKRATSCAIHMVCTLGLEVLDKLTPKKKENFLREHKHFLRHQALGVLCQGTDIIAFGTLRRDRDDAGLKRSPPLLTVQFVTDSGMQKALVNLKAGDTSDLTFVVVNTSTFAYEPILERLQKTRELPLEDQLLTPKKASDDLILSASLSGLIESCKSALRIGAEVKLPVKSSSGHHLRVRGAQLESLIHGLSRPLAQIQGPPGTGKSFIGALIVQLILMYTNHRIMLLSYTNHALDQFVEDLIKIGVEQQSVVRLGSKSTVATESTKLDAYLKGGAFRLTQLEWNIVSTLKTELAETKTELDAIGETIERNGPSNQQILDYLEFSETYALYCDAFQPPQEDGFHLAGRKNKEHTPASLYSAWLWNVDQRTSRLMATALDGDAKAIWQIPGQHRQALHQHWSNLVQREQLTSFAELAARHDSLQRQIDNVFDESKRKVLSSKRVIACTTTGAAMYHSIIGAAQPDVVMVEEAGEILEAHVVTALAPETKQLILIGDHKQLKPKVQNYALTFEKGDGYDLNVSMFERLIRHGSAFTTLREQHRSHPDISSFARMLAYDNLEDVDKTRERDPIRGLQNRVTFVHHEHPEDDLVNVMDRRDPGAQGSKRNTYEAGMVWKTVKYLGQQGYKTENMVVLTPYLGQLSVLRDVLHKENDPVLNDLDSGELLRAGLITQAAANVNKRPLRLSTVDNYQGEESDIVIVSLTRSNGRGDIGFLSARERLVVLMSRARDGIILFGNMHTFMGSKKGKEFWTQYLEYLQKKRWIFDGLPTYCEQHPDRRLLLKKPDDFDQHCPDGGCAEQCDKNLKCGHKCPRRCHRLNDHSQASCQEKLSRTCPRGHKEKLICGKESQGCAACAREDAETRRRVQRDLELEKTRLEAQDKYRKQLEEMDDELDHLKRTMDYDAEKEKQEKELQDKMKKLKQMQRDKEQADKLKKSLSGQANASTAPPIQFDTVAGGAQEEWRFLKENESASNNALEELMGMIGLESVKQEFLNIKISVDTKVRQDVSLQGERFSCSLLGNPGTGKTTVARIWAKFLTSIGAVSGSCFEEATGAKLASDGTKGCEALLEKIKNSGGGVLFIDEAYQLSSGNSPGGKAVLDFLLAEVENLRGKVVFVLAGYSKQMESFFAHNPGFPSRFPIEMKFEDYDDTELLNILHLQIHKRYKGRMKIEDGTSGLYSRITIRRVGHSRGKEGFGNARAVENCIANIAKRQATRLRRERRAKKQPDDFLLTKEDMIGPEPSQGLQRSKGWKALQEMTGLDEVKEAVKVLLDTIKTNYKRELAEEPLVEFSLNRVLAGSPGTGKTTVAKHYGQILVDLGLLSNGEVVVKNPSDFVGAHLGHSEQQTKGILAATVGKVLVIDEAYGLYGGCKSTADPYKEAVIDTIVAEVQSVPGEDRCVLLLGYQDKMEEMFQNVNPGLSRRFPMASAFIFADFDDESLAKILDVKLNKTGFKATDHAKRVAMEVLRRARNRPNFGNAGEIDILLDRAKASHQKRASANPAAGNGPLEPVDFDAEYDRAERSSTNIRKLFEGDVGREALIEKLEGFQKTAKDCKELDIEPDIPFNFLFRGPPGTGKTTTARNIGKVYYDMGFLATAQVFERSATDLIGEYVGQTGPKVQKLAEEALGRVLFVDEAYRLREGHFAKEALDELVDLVTKPKFYRKLIIVLAGYVNDINSLIATNPGMTSRFPEVIDFAPLGPNECFALMHKFLESKKRKLEEKGRVFDMTCLISPRAEFKELCKSKFEELSAQDGWASARDVQNLTRSIFSKKNLALQENAISENDVLIQMNNMLTERGGRMKQRVTSHPLNTVLRLKENTDDAKAPTIQTTTSTKQSQQADEDESEESWEVIDDSNSSTRLAIRDAGVSDEVWEQLQRDAAEEARKEGELRELKKKQKTASGADRERIVREILEEEARKKREQEMKKKLKMAGRCPVGYEWIKQAGGYRCAGGPHYMSDADVTKM